MHKQVARELVGDVRVFDIRLEKLTRLIADTVADHGTRLPEVSHWRDPGRRHHARSGCCPDDRL